MKWICNYYLKVMDKDNFIDVLESRKTMSIMPGVELRASVRETLLRIVLTNKLMTK
jgi:hypothetical protein